MHSFGSKYAMLAGLFLGVSTGCASATSETALEIAPDGGVPQDDVAADANSDGGGDTLGADGSDTGSTPDAPDASGPELPPMVGTALKTLRAVHALENTSNNPSLPEHQRYYLDNGYGEIEWAPGEPHVARAIDGSAVPALGPKARPLVRFAHLADLQLADDESPARVANADTKGATSAALRPQDPYLCNLMSAAVHTINGLNKVVPIQFTMLGGDNVDSAQNNELDWVLGILGGGRKIECDSGSNDDLVSGPDNDPKDPFVPEGLDIPWWWVSGNHDELVQGNYPVGGTVAGASPSTGSFSLLGTRDYRNAAGEGRISHTGLVADPRRETMTSKTLMSRIAAMGYGHGIGAPQVDRGKAFYHFDVPGTPVRFIVLDTAAEGGGASGMLHRADVDKFVKPALDEAKATGKWVILSSHHSVEALTVDGGTFGSKQPDAMLPDEWKAFIGGYPNVLFSIVGHNHNHDVKAIVPAKGTPWWEVMTASIADFPHQFRFVEIWDGDNGWVMLRATVIDLDLESNALGAAARKLGVVDYTTGWSALREPGPTTKRNVELWARKPGS
jgi:hypothetical protein